MPKTTLTKRIEFSASHRYHNPSWDAARNRATFGPSNNETGHGHNYLLEVTLRGEVDGVTGMIINLYDLKRVLTEVLEEFDHKHLNLDTPYFENTLPTMENFAWVLWQKFLQRPETKNLESIRLYEDEDLFAEITDSMVNGKPSSPMKAPEAWISRSYPLSVGCSTPPGKVVGEHHTVEVTIRGPIDPDTGLVTHITALDRLIQTQVLRRFDGTHLVEDPAFQDKPASPGNLASLIWNLLFQEIPGGQLEKVALREMRGMAVEFTG